MSADAASDAGFIAVDAMVATVLLALVGTVVTTIAVGILQRQSEDMDRTVALVALQSLMRQVELLGSHGAPTESSDELFDYLLEAGPSTGALTEFTVSAHRRGDPEVRPISLQFLAPTTGVVR